MKLVLGLSFIHRDKFHIAFNIEWHLRTKCLLYYHIWAPLKLMVPCKLENQPLFESYQSLSSIIYKSQNQQLSQLHYGIKYLSALSLYGEYFKRLGIRMHFLVAGIFWLLLILLVFLLTWYIRPRFLHYKTRRQDNNCS
jgi:hypothetical protein